MNTIITIYNSNSTINNTSRNEAPLVLEVAHSSMLISKLIQSVFSALPTKSGMTEAGLFQIIVVLE